MLLLSDMVEQLSTFTQLGDQEADPVRLPSLEKLNDIWVVKGSQNADLILEGFVVSDS